MKITIKNLQGKPTEYEVTDTETLEDVKKKISEEFKTEVSCIKLIHYGKVLAENSKKLIEYGVKDKDFLVMMISKVTSIFGVNDYRNRLKRKKLQHLWRHQYSLQFLQLLPCQHRLKL